MEYYGCERVIGETVPTSRERAAVMMGTPGVLRAGPRARLPLTRRGRPRVRLPVTVQRALVTDFRETMGRWHVRFYRSAGGNGSSAPCGALRESGGSVRCRSCRRHNVKKRKADAAIAARLGAAGEAPVNPSPTARHITGGSQQGAYFPSGLDEQPSVGPPPTRIVGASEWPAAAALSGFSAGAGVCQAFPPPLPNESKAT